MPTSGKPIGIINTRPSDSLLLEFSSVGAHELIYIGCVRLLFRRPWRRLTTASITEHLIKAGFVGNMLAVNPVSMLRPDSPVVRVARH